MVRKKKRVSRSKTNDQKKGWAGSGSPGDEKVRKGKKTRVSTIAYVGGKKTGKGGRKKTTKNAPMNRMWDGRRPKKEGREKKNPLGKTQPGEFIKRNRKGFDWIRNACPQARGYGNREKRNQGLHGVGS